MEVSRKKWRWIFAILSIILQNVQGFDGLVSKNGCDRYVDCRNELLEMHWRCAEVSRRTTQHACKIYDLFGQHKMTSYEIENIYAGCTKRFEALNDIDDLMEIESECSINKQMATPNHYTSANCWSELIRMTQKCFALSRCCPSSQRCYNELRSTEVYQQYETEKTTLKSLLDTCVQDMESLRRYPISRDDGIIAMKVNDNAQQLLRSVVPFRIFPDPQSKKVLNAAPTDSTGFRRPLRKVLKHRYGISKPKYEAVVASGTTVPQPPLTTSLSPITALHTGPVSNTESPVKSLDFDSKRRYRIRKNKKRRFRKRKITQSGEQQHFQRASVIEKSNFDAQHAAAKLDKLSRNLKQKGEYGMSFIPKMLLVKQNKGRFLGYAQPFIRPLEKPENDVHFFDGQHQFPKKQSIDQIYDDIIESQRTSYPPTTLQFTQEQSWTREPFSLPPIKSTYPTVTSTTSTTSTTTSTTPPTTTSTTTTTTSTTTPIPITTTSFDPFVDYVRHELLEKHMEKEKNDDDFDFSSESDYIDISANVGTTTITNVTTRTTATPLIAAKLGEQTIDDLIPLPSISNSFGTEEVTPSSFISTTELNNHLWPIPIRKVHRLKMMGEKVAQHMRPIVILPIKKHNEEKMREFKKRKLLTGCQRYDKCLRKEVEMRIRCAKPYPKPYDKCSAQLLPLYRLIDEASNNKLQFFIKCISGVNENISRKCLVHKPIDESEVTCENIEVWTDYCKSIEKCCESKSICEETAENSHVGGRLRLLEKSFSLRAAACQFKHAFHRSLVQKH